MHRRVGVQAAGQLKIPSTSLVSSLCSSSYHDKGAVEVETLATALGHHEPASALAVLQHGPDEEQQAEEGVRAQEQQLPAVVVPVSPGQVPRSAALLLVQVRRLQPVSSTDTERDTGLGLKTVLEEEEQWLREQEFHLMVRFSMTSGKFSSSALSSSKVMAPLLSLSADSNSASVRSSSFSSGREMALSRRHDFKTVRSSSGSMEPLPAQDTCTYTHFADICSEFECVMSVYL